MARAQLPSLLQLLRQRRTEGFDLGLLLGIDEVAVRAEGLKSRWDGDLVGEQRNAEIPEEHPQGNESAQTAESTGRGCHDHGTFPGQCGDRRLVWAVAARDPVDSILQSGGVGAVVFRRGNQESLM